MKMILALAAAPLVFASTLCTEATAAPAREQGRCWTVNDGERYCKAVSTVRMPAQRPGTTPNPRKPSDPRPIVERSVYRSPRQVCRFEDRGRYYGSSDYYRGYRGYNAEPRIIDVDNELRKRDMPVCLPGQYPYTR